MIKITLFYFIISMFIGIMILYVIHPEPKVIVKYPTIDKSFRYFYIKMIKVHAILMRKKKLNVK